MPFSFRKKTPSAAESTPILRPLTPIPPAPAPRPPSPHAGSALVASLLAISVLTIIVIAFLQSMTIEKRTSRSYAQIEQSYLAAQTGLNLAIAHIRNLLSAYPYHATGVMKSNANATTTFPVLLGADQFAKKPNFHPLAPYPNFQTTDTWTPPPLSSNPNSTVNLNSPSVSGPEHPLGWIGSYTAKINGQWQTIRPVCPAPWFEIRPDPSSTPQPNPKKPNFNPVLARFALWVEDESMKLDLFAAGNSAGPGHSFARNATVSRSPSELDLGALPLKNNQPLPQQGSGADNKLLLDFLQKIKSANATSDPLLLNQIPSFPNAANLAHRVKFHASPFALSNELTSNGTRRINLNALVNNSFSASVIQNDLTRIQNAINATLANFGKRFFTYPSTNATTERIYKLRLAANIRDYIDSDSQPTYVNETWQAVSGSPLLTSWQGGGDEPKALGHEAIPYFNEHAWRARLLNLTILSGNLPNTRSVTFTMDHYFEFYNPTTKDWTAPKNTKLRAYNFSYFEGNQHPPTQLQDFELDLSDCVFPAGTAVVITTAPEEDEPPNMTTSDAVVYRINISPNLRQYNNRLGNLQIGSETGNFRRFGIRHYGRSSTNLAPDYESEFVLTTPQGVITASPVLALAGSGSPFEMSLSLSNTGTWALPADQRDRRFIWGHSLRGNDAPSRSGDPRSYNEPLEIYFGTATAGNDQYRFFNNYQGETQYTQPLPGTYSRSGNPRLTLGHPANPEFVDPSNWPDYHPSLQNGAAYAYAVIADAPMQSIGELGHIYDPHRKLDPTSPRGILTARGGGRTLKIGQQDDLVGNFTAEQLQSRIGLPARFTTTGNTTHVSWFNGAWHLCDFFSAEPPSQSLSNSTARGKININGVLRDGGTAFRAALRNFLFLPAPEGDPARAGNPLAENEMDELIRQLSLYLEHYGPMMSRGEFGQLPFFSASGTAGTAGGHPSSTAMDRSREEIFRRTVELITTRGLSFRIYVLAEAIRHLPNGEKKTTARRKLEALVSFDPVLENDKVKTYSPKIHWTKIY